MSHQVRVIEGLRFDRIPFDELFAGNEPVLMRGLTADWPLVQAARQGPTRVMELLAGNYNKKPVIVYVGDPEMRGRFGYNESATGFNYGPSVATSWKCWTASARIWAARFTLTTT